MRPIRWGRPAGRGARLRHRVRERSCRSRLRRRWSTLAAIATATYADSSRHVRAEQRHAQSGATGLGGACRSTVCPADGSNSVSVQATPRTNTQQTGLTMDPAPVRKERLIESRAGRPATPRRRVCRLDGDHVRLSGANVDRSVQERLPILIGGNGARLLGAAGQLADIVGLQGLGRTLEDGHRHEVKWTAAHLDQQIEQVLPARATGSPNSNSTRSCRCSRSPMIETLDSRRSPTGGRPSRSTMRP